MKKHELLFSALKVPFDFIIVFSVFFIAREIRLVTDLIPGIQLPIQTIDTQNLIIFALFGSLIHITTLALHGLYSIKIFNSKIKEFLEVIQYSLYSFIFFSVTVYLGEEFIFKMEIPRLIVIFSFFFGTIFIILERVILNNIQYYLLKKGRIPKRNILIVSNSKKINPIINDILKANIYNIVGYINQTDVQINNIKYLGNMNHIQKYFEKKICDEILYINSDFSQKKLYTLWELSRIFGIRYRYITNSFDITMTNTTLSLINNIPVIEIQNTPLENWGKIIKRLFDIFAGIIGLLVVFPLMVIIAILIKLEDPTGPIFYKNKRIGEKNKEFDLYKFRYMKWEYCIKDAYGINKKEDEALAFEKKLIEKLNSRQGPLYKIKNDPRKTKIGTFIEKYSIDELPQFFNIILGNMSLVGPRPHQPREVEKYSLNERRLLTIKPGITGMAQVNGREKNEFKKEAELDLFYIENWSILLDLKITLKTFSVIIDRIKK